MFSPFRIFRQTTHHPKSHFDIKHAQSKWQQQWPILFRNHLPTHPKFYCLVQFPYPSGKLHLGHARVYYISDTIAHFHRLKQHHVIHPIGWDSFGLPAENAAITHKVNPLDWTEQNIQEMRKQLLQIGVSFDWERELATHKPDYYKWTQLLFLKLYSAGLAYKKQAQVNWDPIDKTVLANQQVDSNGNSWRSGAKVQKKRLSQWFFKITEYARELQEDLKLLERWPSRVKEMQAGWIGAKEGHRVAFQVLQEGRVAGAGGGRIQVFTTRVETIMGCTFIAVPVETRSGKIRGYCRHPLTQQKIPIYQADFVLKDFGTGAIMGVPAHNQNDQIFASKHNIPLRIVVEKHIINGKQQLMNSGKFSGLELQQGRKRIAERLSKLGLCESHTELHIKDWLVSRQRYWGAPIPMVYCKSCGMQPVLQQSLPILLPRSNLSSGNPLLTPSFLSTQCPKCLQPASRQTDTLDTFVDSSWYYLRYLDPNNQLKMFDPSITKLMPADVYIGGIEHAIMHLLYARFVYKFLLKQGMLEKDVGKEPFEQLIVQGLVKGKAVRVRSNGRYLTKEQAKGYKPEELEEVFEKMSKSKFNGVNPTELVEKYGCDALRMAMMFSAPVQNDLDFKEEEVQRMESFLKRVIQLKQSLFLQDTKQQNKPLNPQPSDLETIQRIIELIQNMQASLEKLYTLHVYAARIMQFYNILKSCQKSQMSIELQQFLFRIFTVCMIPLSPHVSYEILSQLPKPEGFIEEIIKQNGNYLWPKVEILKKTFACDNRLQAFISINNKFREKVRFEESILKNPKQEALIEQLISHPSFTSLKTQQIKKVIVQNTPKGYIINILIKK